MYSKRACSASGSCDGMMAVYLAASCQNIVPVTSVTRDPRQEILPRAERREPKSKIWAKKRLRAPRASHVASRTRRPRDPR